MAGMIEVHEKMLAQLQQRNLQLQQEKAEVELRLRQAMMLLSELQSVWMELDLPPKLAASISKVLSGSTGRSPREHRNSNGPQMRRSISEGAATDSGAATDRAYPQKSGSISEAPATARAGWFNFNVTDMFGCTTPRDGGDKVPVPTKEGADRLSPLLEEKRPAPAAPIPRRRDTAESHADDIGRPEPDVEPNSARSSGSNSSSSSEPPSDLPRFGAREPADNGKKRLSTSGERPSMPPLPLCQMVQIQDDTAFAEDSEPCLAENMVDLLKEVPGATALIAEIDVLCNALQREAMRAHRHLEHRIESLKTEARQHRQNLEESYLRTTAAQHEELQLCKAKLNQTLMEIMPSCSMGGELELELCDAEWDRCQRVSDQRARAGQAHADWLEVYFTQRLDSTEAFRDAVQHDFLQDLEGIWQRKAVLQARFRNRLNFAGEEARIAGNTIEIASLRNDMQTLSREALVPLQALAETNGRIEKDEIARLKTVMSDAKSQCKAATHQLTAFLEECKVDAEDLKSSQNAELFAHAHLRQRTLLIIVFRGWLETFLRLKMTSKQRDYDKKDAEISVYEDKLDTLGKTYTKLQERMQGTLASRTSAVEFVQSHLSQGARINLAFCVWVSFWLDIRLVSARQDLSTSVEEACSLKVSLQSLEDARAGSEKQLQRAHTFWTADKTLHWLQNDKNRKQAEQLVAIFAAWNAKRMETRLEGALETLEAKNVQSAESLWALESLRSAVGFAQRRTARRAMLAVAFCSWATQALQHMARQFQRQEELVRRRTDEKLERLRQTVMDLVDDCDVEGSAPMLTPRKARRQLSGDVSRRSSIMSQASSIAGGSPSISGDDA